MCAQHLGVLQFVSFFCHVLSFGVSTQCVFFNFKSAMDITGSFVLRVAAE